MPFEPVGTVVHGCAFVNPHLQGQWCSRVAIVHWPTYSFVLPSAFPVRHNLLAHVIIRFPLWARKTYPYIRAHLTSRCRINDKNYVTDPKFSSVPVLETRKIREKGYKGP